MARIRARAGSELSTSWIRFPSALNTNAVTERRGQKRGNQQKPRFEKKQKSHLVIVRRSEMAINSGKSIRGLGVSFCRPVSATPTAPDEYILSLWNSVTGLPVINGVEDAMRPTFKTA